MESYRARVVDVELDELSDAPALALEGPKGVGKTSTALRRAKTIFALDDTTRRDLLAADPALLRDSPGPILIDEWQRWPEVWDHVRRLVDVARGPGILLTGSAVPTDAPVHSGAGRILSLRMRPMTLSERGVETPTVSLAGLLAGHADVGGHTEVAVDRYIEEIASSGFPSIRAERPRLRRAQLDGYLARIVEREFPEAGFVVRRPAALRSWLTAYAAATATTTSYEKLLRATLQGQADPPTKVTAIAYREALLRLWLLDPVPAWTPSRNPLARLGQGTKHHLADPALALRLLGLDPGNLRTGSYDPVLDENGPLLGRMFESLVALSLQTYAQASECRLFHLRTNDGRHEVDFVVERPDGRVVAIEAKLGGIVGDDEVRHLAWLKARLGDRLVGSAVITTGSDAYRRPDGIAVIPAALLGP